MVQRPWEDPSVVPSPNPTDLGPELYPGEVHVWVCDPGLIGEATVCWALGLLNHDERLRVERTGNLAKRTEQILARGGLRAVLSRLTNASPQALAFTTTGRGKPVLAVPGDSDLEFNVSHAADLLVIAATRGRRIGVDVETVRQPENWLRIAERFFSADEVRALKSLPEGRRSDAFLTCWVRKEALVKATGGGIASGLRNFDVEVRPDQPPRLLSARGGDLGTMGWNLADLSLGPHHRACVAAEGAAEIHIVPRGTPFPA